MKTRKDAEISMSLVSALVLLDLAALEDAIHVMSHLEDEFKVPGGEYISLITLILSR